jgi:ribosomal protein S4E
MVNNQTAESYTLLRDKHERLQVENIKTENELKLLKVEYRKL